MAVIIKFFAECICQSGEAAKTQIEALQTADIPGGVIQEAVATVDRLVKTLEPDNYAKNTLFAFEDLPRTAK